MNKTLLFVLTIPACLAVHAASFDCKRAATHTETLVCADSLVSRLDSQLQDAYMLSLNGAKPTEKRHVVDDQNTWLKDVRDKCETSKCLSTVYAERIGVLTLIKTDRTSANYVVDQQHFLDRVSALASAMQRSGFPGTLENCRFVIRLISAHGNGSEQSFGAICNWSRREIMLCDDTLIGKLTVRLEGFAISGSVLADFTNDNCPPGG